MLQEHQLTPYHCDGLPCADGPWLVLAPHADDESFGMGGSLAKASQAGIATYVVVMTDGALGGTASDLVVRRQQEVLQAAQVLGVQQVYFLAEPDRGLQVSTALCGRVQQLIEQIVPAALFFPGALELHPDHRSTALIAWQCLQNLRAMRLSAFSYEITGQSPANVLVDITGVMLAKRQAMQCYLSQLAENNYQAIVEALNTLRTLTLGPDVRWAEGFYRFTEQELEQPLAQWLQARMAAFVA
jgi:N-acetylglucosamine malate deacetylase 1